MRCTPDAGGAAGAQIVRASARGAVRRAAEVLRRGGVVVFPTETVYGLGVRAGDPAARRRLARLKGRDDRKPFQILAADARAARALCPRMPPAAARLARRCWPGPLTLVAHRGGGKWVGLRVPDHAVARRLIRAAGGALTATSANRAGGRPATTAAEAAAALGARPDLVLDGGAARCGAPSTVVKVTREGWRLLREGAIPASEIERIVGTPPLS
jgi:L-threonylcarbamoyladenylate synthase